MPVPTVSGESWWMCRKDGLLLQVERLTEWVPSTPLVVGLEEVCQKEPMKEQVPKPTLRGDATNKEM